MDLIINLTTDMYQELQEFYLKHMRKQLILRYYIKKWMNRDDLSRLQYVSMCIKEALRLHTPVPMIERMITKDMYIDGYFVPAGYHG